MHGQLLLFGAIHKVGNHESQDFWTPCPLCMQQMAATLQAKM
jgi:hypothetical protein